MRKKQFISSGSDEINSVLRCTEDGCCFQNKKIVKTVPAFKPVPSREASGESDSGDNSSDHETRQNKLKDSQQNTNSSHKSSQPHTSHQGSSSQQPADLSTQKKGKKPGSGSGGGGGGSGSSISSSGSGSSRKPMNSSSGGGSGSGGSSVRPSGKLKQRFLCRLNSI